MEEKLFERLVESLEQSQASVGWKVWGGDQCDHCCTDKYCDYPDHLDRKSCPYCKGTGKAIWLNEKP